MSIFESLENLAVSENCFNEIIDKINGALDSIIEDWNGSTGVSHHNDPYWQRTRQKGIKRVEMSPDDYIKKVTNMAKRSGCNVSKNQLEKSRAENRENIEDLKSKIASKDAKIDEPYLQYNQELGNKEDEQEGLHRAVAAKELGHDKIPVHIIHPTKKRTPIERKKYKDSKKK